MAEEQTKTVMPENDARAYLAAIVDCSDDAILSKTLDGTVVSWNRGAERMYGYPAAEAVGRHISFLVPPDRLEELQQLSDRIARGERAENVETVRTTRDGRAVWVSLTLSPVLGTDGAVIGISSIARDITERREMERCLKESEKRYRTLVEMAPDAVVVHQENRLVYANCAALGIFGAKSLEELQGASLIDLIRPEDREQVLERVRQLLQGEEIPLREFGLQRLTGEQIAVEASSSLIDYHGRPSIQIIARDITGRKRMEAERERMLKEIAFERSRFETVVRQMPVGVMIAEAPSGRLIYDNEESKRIFRYEIGDVGGIEDYGQWPLFRQDGSPLPVEEYPIVRAMHGATVSAEELCIERGDGTRGCVSVNAIPIRDNAEEIVAGLATFQDITLRKEAAKALHESEQRLNLALDAAEMGSCDINVRTGKGIWSTRHYLLLGYPPPADGTGEASFDMWLSLVHEDDREQVTRGFEEAKWSHAYLRSEHRIVRADNGEVVWVDVMGRFLCDEAGDLCRFIGVIFDVTERKKAEEQLRDNEATLKLAIEATGLGIFDWDVRSGRHDWSDIAKMHYGLPPDTQMDHETLRAALHPEDRERVEQAILDALAPQAADFSAKYRTVGLTDGKQRWISARGRVMRDETGTPLRMFGACLDITDIVEAETALKDEIAERLRAVEELRRQEQLMIRQGRLAAMGEMIGNIAHQWRQPLNTLGLIVQELPKMYERELFNKEYLEGSVARAMQVINYMSKTIDGFRNFFGQDKEKEPFKVAEVLARTVAIVEAAFKELKLAIEVEADQELVVFGYPNEFSQVILNILVNARDAIIDRKVHEPKVSVRLFREDARTVLTVADNAGGIAADVIERIFDPYFTTKEPDKGTGIGLFMSRTIIEKNMGGSLTVRNTEKGAEFRIEV